MNKNYPDPPCYAPVSSLAISATGYLRPCCWWKGKGKNQPHIGNTSLKQYRTNFLLPMYKEMEKNNYPENCELCLQPGYTLSDEYVKYIDSDTVKTLDLRFGNLCNLGCAICNSKNSNYYTKLKNKGYYLFENQIQEYASDWERNPKNLEQILEFIDTVETLYITGGEPSINPVFNNLLDHCIDNDLNKKIHLEINTNLTNASELFLDKLYSFSTVSVMCSIDGVADLNDAIRHPSNFNFLIQNLKKYDNYCRDDDLLIVTPTISILNYFKLNEYFNFFDGIIENSKNIVYPGSLNILYDPKWLSINSIPDYIFDAHIEKVKTKFKYDILDKRKEGLISSEWTQKLEYIRKYFKSRNFDPKITGIPGI